MILCSDHQPLAKTHKINQMVPGHGPAEGAVPSLDLDKNRSSPGPSVPERADPFTSSNPTYGGINLVELRRASILMLANITIRQRFMIPLASLLCV